MNTLVFCTSWAPNRQLWEWRYGKWIAHVRQSALHYDQILMVDDGSPVVPDFGSMTLLDAERLPAVPPAGDLVFARFSRNLGRRAALDYPGWWRSFMFVADYATRYGFDKVLHVESDTYVLSARLQEFLNSRQRGWLAFWCPRWQFPETCLQVICADQLPNYCAVAGGGYERSKGRPVEKLLPFTRVETGFKGDRYGEYRTDLPRDADYAAQVLLGTAVWNSQPPVRARMAALSVGAAVLAPNPALYPDDAWEIAATARTGAAKDAGCAEIIGSLGTGLDALQLSLDAAAQAESLAALWGPLRRRLADGGELAVRLPGGVQTREMELIARSISRNGFAFAHFGLVPQTGGWIIARADRDRTDAIIVDEQIRVRLRTAVSLRP